MTSACPIKLRDSFAAIQARQFLDRIQQSKSRDGPLEFVLTASAYLAEGFPSHRQFRHRKSPSLQLTATEWSIAEQCKFTTYKMSLNSSAKKARRNS